MSTIQRVVTVVLVFGLAGCASARVEGVAQPLPDGRQALTMELVNFAFRPNVVAADAGRTITITAVSMSIAKHNVTIVSPGGEVLASVDVPARETRSFEVSFPRPGTYELYCDVWLHTPLGMRGRFLAQ